MSLTYLFGVAALLYKIWSAFFDQILYKALIITFVLNLRKSFKTERNSQN